MNEKEVEILLANWFKSYNIKVWFNRTSQGFDQKFNTKGITKKPDLIIFSNDNYYALEIKNADASNKNVYDSTKIINYMKDYTENKIDYYINNKKIKMSAFLIATQYSIQGKLFSNDSEIVYPKDEKWHKILNSYKNEPQKEYNFTRKFIRQLWAYWRISRTTKDLGIGVLLSSVLDDNNVCRPKIFYQNKEYNYKKQKERWYVRWQTL